MANLMDRAIIFIMEIKEYTRVTGKMAKSKDLVNQSSMINMVILGNGEKIRKMAEDLISTPMVKDIKEDGSKTRKKVKEFIDIEMVMCMMVDGKMIEDKEMVQ